MPGHRTLASAVHQFFPRHGNETPRLVVRLVPRTLLPALGRQREVVEAPPACQVSPALGCNIPSVRSVPLNKAKQPRPDPVALIGAHDVQAVDVQVPFTTAAALGFGDDLCGNETYDFCGRRGGGGNRGGGGGIGGGGSGTGLDGGDPEEVLADGSFVLGFALLGVVPVGEFAGVGVAVEVAPVCGLLYLFEAGQVAGGGEADVDGGLFAFHVRGGGGGFAAAGGGGGSLTGHVCNFGVSEWVGCVTYLLFVMGMSVWCRLANSMDCKTGEDWIRSSVQGV